MSKELRSVHEPRVRDGLCRHIRSKGMIVNIGEAPEVAWTGKRLLAADRNLLPYDATVWWCDLTSKVIGPDDRPCHKDRCMGGRECFEAENDAPVA